MVSCSLLFFSALLMQNAPAAVQTASVPAGLAVPKPALTLQERGDIYMARKMFREAIEMYKQVPRSPMTLNKIGIAYHQLTEVNMAERYYSQAVKMDPMFTEAMNNLGTVYYFRKSYRRAITQYKKVLRIKPNSASTLANLASAYFARKQYDLGQQMLDQALAIDPDVLEARGGVGAIVRDRSVLDKPTFFYQLAKSYAKQGRNDRALTYIRKALEEGFKEREKFSKEPEFAGLQSDPEFQKLMAVEPKVL